MTNVIKVEGLTKLYGNFPAVNDISFSVNEGEVFGILGPNGAGKTTTMEILEGLRSLSSGKVSVLGMDITRERHKIKHDIGIQLQASAYFEYLNLTEILKLFGSFYSHSVPPEQLLDRVGLLDRAKDTLGKLSGGQRQRFTIAATLVNSPRVVFLDEPTTGLDPQSRHNVWEIIREIHNEGRSVILTTHYMEEAEMLCHRVAIMDVGSIVALDKPKDLVFRLDLPYEVKVMADGHLDEDDLRTLGGVDDIRVDANCAWYLGTSDAELTMESVLSFSVSKGIRLTHLEVLQANLEDVFLAITGRHLRE